jgi:hypothetical protein
MAKIRKYETPSNISLKTRQDSDPVETENPAPITSATLQFIDGRSVVNLPALTRLEAKDTDELSNQMSGLSDFQNLHTVLARRSANHPSRFGMVAKPFPSGHIGLKPITADEAAGGGGSGNFWSQNSFSALELNLELLPVELSDDNHGWFAPDADLSSFGTMYLVPTGNLDTDSWRARDQIETFGWALAQVGIEGHLGLVEWNDASGVETLAKRALSDDVELVTTMRALEDSVGVSDGLKRHRYRQALRDAREHFPSLSLRPRLVPGIVEETLRDHAMEEFRSYSREEGVVSGMVTLDDYAVYGWRNQPKAIAAGYVLEFKDRPSERKFIAFSTDLASRLSARKLGTLAVLPGDLKRVWVTRDVELTNRFSNVFGASEDEQLIPFSAWLEARTGVGA